MSDEAVTSTPIRDRAPVTLAQIKALNNLLRQEIMASLWSRGPGSARDIAVRLGVDETKLYYHLQKLTRAGLVQSVSSRRTATKPEAIFSAPSGVWISGFDFSRPEVGEEIAKNSDLTFRMTAKEYRAAITCLDPAIADRCLLLRNSVRLKPSVRDELEQRLTELNKWVQKQEDPDGDAYSVTASVTPMLGRSRSAK